MFTFAISKIWTNLQSDKTCLKASGRKNCLEESESDQPHVPDQIWQQSLGDVLDDISLVSRMNICAVPPEKPAGDQRGWKSADLPDPRLRQSSFDAAALYRLVAERPKMPSWPISIRQQTALQISAGLHGNGRNRGARF